MTSKDTASRGKWNFKTAFPFLKRIVSGRPSSAN